MTRSVSCRRNAAYSRGRILGHSRFRPSSPATDQVRLDFRHRPSSLLPKPGIKAKFGEFKVGLDGNGVAGLRQGVRCYSDTAVELQVLGRHGRRQKECDHSSGNHERFHGKPFKEIVWNVAENGLRGRLKDRPRKTPVSATDHPCATPSRR